MRVLILAFLISSLCYTTAWAQVSDISATQITLPIVNSGEKPAFHRVVALANGSAEIVTSLGYHSLLVGRDVASTIPELTKVPIDNPGHTLSSELVLSQKPDLILIDSNTSPASALALLKKSGIRIITIPTLFSVAGVIAKERAVANALRVPKAGELLVKKVTSINFPHKSIKVVFLYLRGTASIYLIGGKGSGADSLISHMGFVDVGAKNLKIPFNAMSSEELVTLNPDVIMLMSKGLGSVGGVKGLLQIPGISQTTAGQHKRFVTVDDSLLLAFGPRTTSLITQLHNNIIRVMKQ
jgi:iron complex transport system substrate-binding protein